MSRRTAIFILGPSHTGTTMIGCILGSSRADVIDPIHVGEIHAYFNPAHTYHGNLSTGRELIGAREFWSKIDLSLPLADAYQQIFSLSGATVLVDSSKNLKWFAIQRRACEYHGYTLRTVLCYRSFFKIFQSDAKRGKTADQSRKNINYYRKLFDLLGEEFTFDLVVDIDDFLFDPRGQAKSLCDRLDIEYFPGKEEYWNFKSIHLYGASTQRRQYLGEKRTEFVRPNNLATSQEFLRRKFKRACPQRNLDRLEKRLLNLIEQQKF